MAKAAPLLAKFQFSMGALGVGDGEFDFPLAVTIDGSGNIYVADQYNHRAQVSGADAFFLFSFGSGGEGDGQFMFPVGVAVDSAENIYVTDSNNHRVQVFHSLGNFQSQFGSRGNGDGQFFIPAGTTIDSAGKIYVADDINHRIQVWATAAPPTSDPVALIDELIATIMDLDIKHGLKESLAEKLNDRGGAKAKPANDRPRRAIEKLRKFIKKVRKKSRKKFAAEDATELKSRAKEIIGLIRAEIEGI